MKKMGSQKSVMHCIWKSQTKFELKPLWSDSSFGKNLSLFLEVLSLREDDARRVELHGVLGGRGGAAQPGTGQAPTRVPHHGKREKAGIYRPYYMIHERIRGFQQSCS